MEKEFIGYNEALALKELGFDESCFGYYIGGDWDHDEYDMTLQFEIDLSKGNYLLDDKKCTAPTFSQAFRFFRKKYKIFPYTYTGNGTLFHYCMFIKDRDNQYHSNNLYLSNEEAELECLKKLISIVKEKK